MVWLVCSIQGVTERPDKKKILGKGMTKIIKNYMGNKLFKKYTYVR